MQKITFDNILVRDLKLALINGSRVNTEVSLIFSSILGKSQVRFFPWRTFHAKNPHVMTSTSLYIAHFSRKTRIFNYFFPKVSFSNLAMSLAHNISQSTDQFSLSLIQFDFYLHIHYFLLNFTVFLDFLPVIKLGKKCDFLPIVESLVTGSKTWWFCLLVFTCFSTCPTARTSTAQKNSTQALNGA